MASECQKVLPSREINLLFKHVTLRNYACKQEQACVRTTSPQLWHNWHWRSRRVRCWSAGTAGCLHTQLLRRNLRDPVDHFYGAGGAFSALLCLPVDTSPGNKQARKQHGEIQVHRSSLQQVWISPSHSWELSSSGKCEVWQFTELLLALNPIVEERIKRHESNVSILQSSLSESSQSSAFCTSHGGECKLQ